MTRSSLHVVSSKGIGRKSFVCRKLFGSLDRIQMKLDFECSWNRLVDQCCHRWNFDFRFRCPMSGGNFGWMPGEKDLDIDPQGSLDEIKGKQESGGDFAHRIPPVARLEVLRDRQSVEANSEVQRRTLPGEKGCERSTIHHELTDASDVGESRRDTRSVEAASSIPSISGFGIHPRSDSFVVTPLPHSLLHSDPRTHPHSLCKTVTVSPLSSTNPTTTPLSSSSPYPDSLTLSTFSPTASLESPLEWKRKSSEEGELNQFFPLLCVGYLEQVYY